MSNRNTDRTPPAAVAIALGLGSNLGDRAGNLRRALALLAAFVEDLRASSFLETAPVDCPPGAGRYLNAAAVGRCRLSPVALHAQCRAVETALGRPVHRGYHEDRVIDVDVLLYGEEVLTHPGLTVPHPDLTRRDFVLVPLAEIAADWRVPPALLTVGEHLRRLPRA